MSGRRYNRERTASAVVVAPKTQRRERRASPKAPKDVPPHRRVADAALGALKDLVVLWPGARYPLLRLTVVHALYQEMAAARGMRALPIEVILPELPTAAAVALRARFNGLPLADLTPEDFGAAHERLSRVDARDGAVVRTDGKTSTTVHFTPRSLTEPIVERTLEPLLKLVPPERTLDLRVCDPSVGAGAFLLALVRQLGQRAFDAGLAPSLDAAKRLVAIHCAYGVDICRYAVDAAKLALRLECRADRMPLDWLDGNLKTGDALVGLTNEQIVAFHWQPDRAPADLVEAAARAERRRVVDEAMALGVAARKARLAELAALAVREGP